MSQEDHLHRINRMLTALSRVNQAILRIRDAKAQLFREVCQIVHDELAYDLVWVAEVREDGLMEGQVWQGLPDSFAHQADGTLTPMCASISLARLAQVAAERGQPVTGEALAAEGLSEPITGSGAKTVIAFPVPLHLEVVPHKTLVMAISLDPPRHLAPDETKLLQEVAGDLGFALDTMLMEERGKQAEAALRISEDRFRRLAEHSLVGIVLIQNDLYRYVNPAFATMFGYDSPREIIDHLGPLDLTAPESQHVVADNVRRRILGQIRAVRYQYRGLRKDGTCIDVEEHGARTVHAQRLAVVASVLDVTAREVSRRRLEMLSRAGLALASAQTAQQALEKAVELVVQILPCTAASIMLLEDGQLRLAVQSRSREGAGMPGACPDALDNAMTTPVWQRVIETREPVVVAGPASAADTHAGGDARTPHVHTCAGVPLIVRDEIIGLLNAVSVAPNHFGEEDAQHLRLFADHVAATLQHLRLIASLEGERNRLRTLNALSHTLSETLMPQEVAARALQQIGHALNADAGLLYLWDAATQRLTAMAADGISDDGLEALNVQLEAAPPATLAHWIATRRPHGNGAASLPLGPSWDRILGLDLDAVRVLDVPLHVHGEPIGVLSFLSERVDGFSKADTELVVTLSIPVALAMQNARFYERTAQQATMMADALRRQEELDQMKDEFIQNISHELRTPLALVMGYAEMLDDGQLGAIPAQQAEAVGIIARRSRMLRSLVEDIALLWHLGRESETEELLDLHEIAETAVLDFGNRARQQGVILCTKDRGEAARVRGVATHMRRVLDNLIGNALKFTEPGGEVRISLRAEEEWATLAVADTGIGVPQDKLHRIFERFYQIDGSPKRRYGGAGLGLALVKAIVEAHHGTVWAESPIGPDPGCPGTRVTVRLPLAACDEGGGNSHERSRVLEGDAQSSSAVRDGSV